ncbi:MAG TPA: D-aminoacylase [Vicinamibacteria bacterium]|nr:D-aminoacylase [Vicinamibacteria bacterium]
MNRREFLASTVGAGLLGVRQDRKLDLVLRGGLVVDGTGAPGRVADVGIGGERIVAIGDLSASVAHRTIDVSGLVVSPGFIDVHTHSEDELLTNPKAESKVRQGVTTEILGMDGGSYEPAQFVEKLRELQTSGIAVNVASFVGQGTIRGDVLAMTDRAANEGELALMRRLAAGALENGALGISSGLEYTPGGFASADEIAELCAIMRGTRGLYATHLRNEDDRVVESVEEAVLIAERAGVGLHISHLKCQGRRNWDKVDRLFEVLDAAEARGVSVSLDRYPYIAYSTSLANLMPLWSREGGTPKFIERLGDASIWPRIREAVADKVALLGSWDAVMVSSVPSAKNKPFEGKTIAQIVQDTGEDPFVATRRLIVEEDNRVGMVGFGMSEENTERILAHPKCMPASDGSALADYGPLAEGNPHPRSYGTFARVLGMYVREKRIMMLQEAVRKMTSLPATRFSLGERGRLSEGFYADVVVFDSSTVADRATFAEPHQYAQGFEIVLANGRILLEKGTRTDELPGKVLLGAHGARA